MRKPHSKGFVLESTNNLDYTGIQTPCQGGYENFRRNCKARKIMSKIKIRTRIVRPYNPLSPLRGQLPTGEAKEYPVYKSVQFSGFAHFL